MRKCSAVNLGDDVRGVEQQLEKLAGGGGRRSLVEARALRPTKSARRKERGLNHGGCASIGSPKRSLSPRAPRRGPPWGAGVLDLS
jgi:hypothetical protein